MDPGIPLLFFIFENILNRKCSEFCRNNQLVKPAFALSLTITIFRFEAKIMVIHPTLPDFILFLYVHLAHVDDSYDPKELSVIKSKMKVLFPSGTDLEKKLYQSIRDYQKFDKAQLGELCADTISFYQNNNQQLPTRLLKDLQDIVNADGHIEKSEAEALAKLNGMLDYQNTWAHADKD